MLQESGSVALAVLKMYLTFHQLLAPHCTRRSNKVAVKLLVKLHIRFEAGPLH